MLQIEIHVFPWCAGLVFGNWLLRLGKKEILEAEIQLKCWLRIRFGSILTSFDFFSMHCFFVFSLLLTLVIYNIVLLDVSS